MYITLLRQGEIIIRLHTTQREGYAKGTLPEDTILYFTTKTYEANGVFTGMGFKDLKGLSLEENVPELLNYILETLSEQREAIYASKKLDDEKTDLILFIPSTDTHFLPQLLMMEDDEHAAESISLSLSKKEATIEDAIDELIAKASESSANQTEKEMPDDEVRYRNISEDNEGGINEPATAGKTKPRNPYQQRVITSGGVSTYRTPGKERPTVNHPDVVTESKKQPTQKIVFSNTSAFYPSIFTGANKTGLYEGHVIPPRIESDIHCQLLEDEVKKLQGCEANLNHPQTTYLTRVSEMIQQYRNHG